MSEILGFRVFLGQVGAKLAKVKFGTNYRKCHITNFASTHPKKLPSPKMSLKIKFPEVLDPPQPKICKSNNFFGGKIGKSGQFLAFLAKILAKKFSF